jgi:hypothetical protein
MSQERLHGLATLHIENKLLDKINIIAIINSFTFANVGRNFLGNFYNLFAKSTFPWWFIRNIIIIIIL